MVQRKTTRRSKKSSSNRGFIFLFITILLAMTVAGGLYYAVTKNKAPDILEKKQSFDLTDESKEAHRLIDGILLGRNNWQLQEIARKTENENIEETGGDVTWISRQLTVGIPPSTDLFDAATWLKGKIKNSDVSVIGEREASYQNRDAYRLDLGITVKAGDGSKTYRTDTIYFYNNGNLTEPDKDIKKAEKPKEEPKKDVDKKQPDKKEPEKTPDAKGKYKGKMAVVIDDAGYSLEPLRTLLDTGYPFSYAILPYKQFSSDSLHLIKSKGRVAMLHLPMEPMDRNQISEPKNTVLTTMSEADIQKMVAAAIDSLPGVTGVNNHQGSKATSDEKTMRAALKTIKAKKLFFVDSNTSGKTVAEREARKLGIRNGKNSLFLDNSSSVSDIYAQMRKAAEMADRYGSIIVICHVRPNTAEAWRLYGKEIEKTGIKIVPVTELLK